MAKADLKDVAQIVAAIIRNIELKRVLHSVEPDPRLNFWRMIYGNCLDTALIEWCKLFGSDGDPAHWKNILAKSDHDNFRNELHAAAGGKEPWQEYREEVLRYRNKHAAHFEPGYSGKYPNLDIALDSTCLYYNRLLALMDSSGIKHRLPPSIDKYQRQFVELATEVARAALPSTSHIKERVR